MNTKVVDSLVQIIRSLTEEERKDLERKLHPQDSKTAENTSSKLRDEPFVGMWKDRKDMCNSSQWVRQARQQEWTS